MTIKPPLPTTTLEHSRQLRRGMTDAERKLWQCRRSGELDGLKFRRQHPIPPYVWDNDVLNQAEAVIEAIWNDIAKPNPHPNPSPDGRGASSRADS